MSFPWDFAPGEGTHIYLALRVVAGEPLYVPNDGFPYLYNVYPPLYHLLLAPLVALLVAQGVITREIRWGGCPTSRGSLPAPCS